MPPITAYQVKFEYCNGQDFKHSYTEVKPATEEYGKLLAEAIEPQGEYTNDVHLRLITLSLFDESDLVRQVDSGVFACPHRAERD
jgi:hypothetical protein